MRRALRPSNPGEFLRSRWLLRPTIWALRPKPRVTFSPMRKSPKNLPEGAPPLGTPPRGTLRSPCGKPHPLDRAFSHKNRPICHFETVGKSVLFFPLVPSGKHFLLSIRGAVGALLPRMLKGLSYLEQYLPGPQESRPGAGRSACISGEAGAAPPVHPSHQLREMPPSRAEKKERTYCSMKTSTMIGDETPPASSKATSSKLSVPAAPSFGV